MPLEAMFHRALHLLKSKRHAFAVRGIFKTEPLAMKQAPLIFVSQLCHRDVAPYLVAIKSIYPAFGEGAVHIVNDGSLTDADKFLLEYHLPLIEFSTLADTHINGTPTGGTWERLTCLINHTEKGFYAVQVDADLLAQKPVTEAADAYRANQAFLLAGSSASKRHTFAAESARHPKPHVPSSQSSQSSQSPQNRQHIQPTCEALLANLREADKRYYIRGTSAFTGFPSVLGVPDAEATLNSLINLSAEMESHLGMRWNEWGTEQLTSNLLLATYRDCKILSQPSYINHGADTSEADLGGASLIHFFGTYRHRSGRYRRLSKDFIRSLL